MTGVWNGRCRWGASGDQRGRKQSGAQLHHPGETSISHEVLMIAPTGNVALTDDPTDRSASPDQCRVSRTLHCRRIAVVTARYRRVSRTHQTRIHTKGETSMKQLVMVL